MSMLEFAVPAGLAAGLRATAAPAVHAETVGSLRVMLHPYAAGCGALPGRSAGASRSRWQAPALTLTGSTRTGAIELALADARRRRRRGGDGPQAARRPQRAVGGADRARRHHAKTAAAEPRRQRSGPPPHGAPEGRRARRSWPELLERIGKRHRHAGHVRAADRADLGAERRARASRQNDSGGDGARASSRKPEVQYADPVRRAHAFAVPNDPYYSQQWSLNGSVAGINAETAWTLQPSAASVTVAVVDTGILPHPDLEGRVLPGYDFISDADRARDGNARDSESARRRRLGDGECGVLRAELLPRPVRGGHHRRQHEQRHRHRGHRRQREHPSRARARQRAAARSRTSSRACCGRRASTSPACPRTRIRPRSST